MITICLQRNSKGTIEKFGVQGHAGFSEAGKDIVCSAVSAIAYTAIGALLNLVDSSIGYCMEDGELQCSLPEHLEQELLKKAEIILETMAIGFLQIENSYSEYVHVYQKEV